MASECAKKEFQCRNRTRTASSTNQRATNWRPCRAITKRTQRAGISSTTPRTISELVWRRGEARLGWPVRPVRQTSRDSSLVRRPAPPLRVLLATGLGLVVLAGVVVGVASYRPRDRAAADGPLAPATTVITRGTLVE